jgi:hypothetical protein
VSPDAHTPAERADAVLRAAEAAAAAAQAAAAAAQAASLPDPAPVPAVAPVEAAAPVESAVEPVESAVEPVEAAEPAAPEPPREPPIHEAGAAGRLLAAAGDLQAHVAQARAQLDALEDALGRLERYDPPGE